MSVKKSVFGSVGEERGFRSIEHTWGEEYAIYPQFQWSALFTPDPNWKDTSNLFFKTSVDYVFCEKSGRPLLAIDFDGMGRGFDRNGEYIQIEPTRDPHRKVKFDFKLRWARNNGFPYYIVSSEEFAQLGDDVQLNVVDGIIGSTLAKRAFDDRVESYVEERVDTLYGLMESDPSTPDHLKPVRSKIVIPTDQENIQYMVSDLEVECDVEFNPFFKMEGKVRRQIGELMYGEGGFWHHSPDIRPFEKPELPTCAFRDFFDFVAHANQVRKRAEAMNRVEVWGCVATLKNTPVGEVSEVVTIRNVAHSTTLVKEIAECMVLCKLLRLLRRQDQER